MIRLETNHPLVSDFSTYVEFTNDAIDNMRGFDKANPNMNGHRDKNFNQIFYNHFGKKLINVLDMGCAHGEMVASFLEDGHLAVGIDACYRYKTESYNWIYYPDNYFSCDLGKDFHIYNEEELIIFDLITSWECLEHIKTEDIDSLMQNIYNHSRPGSIFVGSIGKTHEGVHRTIKDRYWWNNKFSDVNFVECDLFVPKDCMIRKLDNSQTDYYIMIRK